ncbi:MAG: phosphoribosyltransferase family protein [Candidatus Cohnella colombiensis]|uniref:Phosphoribosyltransferase family protein n=1 Tax=Candidatus Cohnella colombiensis TaxID=3121368 RepID=A0AA95F562_9BACL|nr:MAG: phosphoribosyltransferase family protein [Cohnella sp.]
MRTYNIAEGLNVNVTIMSNPYGLPLDALFAMAARINKKRAFLFVSKILGKHIPVNPYVSLLSGAALSLMIVADREEARRERASELLQDVLHALAHPEEAKQVYDKVMLDEITVRTPLTIIGFAETATALGHSVFHVFADGATYLHTTREFIPERTSVLNFDEEHSHAVAHRCYVGKDNSLMGNGPIVLVDDEITTGKTALNIIRDIHAKYPRDHYYIASLLDWRVPEDEHKVLLLEQELGIHIHSLSLIKGVIEVEGSPDLSDAISDPVLCDEQCTQTSIEYIYLDDIFNLVDVRSESEDGWINHSPYITATGRFGITSDQRREIDNSIETAAEQLRKHRISANTLCLGTGEFMYVPMRIAAALGNGVAYHSTTRSPIHAINTEQYAIQSGNSYPSPDDTSVMNFIYNVTFGQYEELFLFLERDVIQARIEPMLDVFRTKGFKQINVVVAAGNG